MKRTHLWAFATLLLPLFFVSCSNDNDLPNVNYNIQLGGGAKLNPDDGTIYVMQGDTLAIKSLAVTNNESGKSAAITDAQYYWDYNYIGGNPFAPYNFNIYITDETPVGGHNLTIQCSVVAVDKTPAVGVIDYPVVVVADSTQMPTTQLTSISTTVPLNSRQ